MYNSILIFLGSIFNFGYKLFTSSICAAMGEQVTHMADTASVAKTYTTNITHLK